MVKLCFSLNCIPLDPDLDSRIHKNADPTRSGCTSLPSSIANGFIHVRVYWFSIIHRAIITTPCLEFRQKNVWFRMIICLFQITWRTRSTLAFSESKLTRRNSSLTINKTNKLEHTCCYWLLCNHCVGNSPNRFKKCWPILMGFILRTAGLLKYAD